MDKHLDTLHQTFPEKPIGISEYGYCAPERRGGDERRIENLRPHDDVIRSKDFVGATSFSATTTTALTWVTAEIGALRQRVQGVVDVCGARKASFAVPGQESGPVESLTVRNRLNVLHLTLSTPYRPV